MLLSAPAVLGASTWTVFETAKGNGHLMSRVESPSESEGAAAAITFDVSRPFQSMEGFGGALTESSAWVLDQLPGQAGGGPPAVL